jgi:hypothetical protein
MSGKIIGLVLILCAALAGGGLYYLQVYGFYEEVAASDAPDVRLVPIDGDTPESIAYTDFRAVDAESSPIRFRGCFSTDAPLESLSARFTAADNVTPRNAPGWFDCFDAEAIATELAAGTARAFIGQKNIHYGVDRIVAITTDGRGFIWHDLNDCGEKAYDGTVVGEECPPRPQNGDS